MLHDLELPSPVQSLSLVGGDRVAVGLKNGNLLLLNASLTTEYSFALPYRTFVTVLPIPRNLSLLAVTPGEFSTRLDAALRFLRQNQP